MFSDGTHLDTGGISGGHWRQSRGRGYSASVCRTAEDLCSVGVVQVPVLMAPAANLSNHSP